MRITVSLLALVLLLSGCASSARLIDQVNLKQQVMDTERSFARTMADRDHRAFTTFLAEETIFFAGETPLQGKEQVAAWWSQYFEPADAPFSWEPEQVEVLESGTLALSTGPVHDPEGNLIGTFTSIWRQEADGRWRIIFDRGSPACN